jgi:hypothetical protein
MTLLIGGAGAAVGLLVLLGVVLLLVNRQRAKTAAAKARAMAAPPAGYGYPPSYPPSNAQSYSSYPPSPGQYAVPNGVAANGANGYGQARPGAVGSGAPAQGQLQGLPTPAQLQRTAPVRLRDDGRP